MAYCEGHMQPGTKARAKIEALLHELVSINASNILYWKTPGQSQTHEEKAEYQRRQNRAQEIRAEIAQLRSGRDA